MNIIDKFDEKSEERKCDEILKKHFFVSFEILLSNNICKKFIYYILTIYEFLQMCSFLYESYYLSSTTDHTIMLNIVKFFDFAFIPSSTQSFFFIFLILLGIEVVLTSLVVVFQIYTIWNKKGVVLNTVAKLITLLWMINSKILFTPIILIFSYMFFCQITIQNQTFNVTPVTCYQEVHVCLIILSSIFIILVFLYEILFSIFFHEFHPDSSLPWAKIDILQIFIRLLKKIIFIISILILQKTSFGYLVLLIATNILNILSLYEIFKGITLNDSITQFINLASESYFIWMALLVGVNYFVKLELICDILFLIPIPIILISVNCIISLLREKVFFIPRPENLKSSKDVVEYISMIIKLSPEQTKFKNYILLRGSIANHMRNCISNNCNCEELFKSLDSNNQDEVISNGSNMGRSVKHLSFKTAQQKNVSERSQGLKIEMGAFNPQFLYDFLIKSINRSIETLGKKPNLYLQLAYIHFLYVDNKFMALYDISDALEHKPSLIEEYAGFILNKRIEDNLLQKNDQKEGNSIVTASANVSLYNLIPFQEKFAEFQNKMNKLLELYMTFWKELLEESPNFVYLNKLGYIISRDTKHLKRVFFMLVKANPNNLQCRMLYALFIKKIEKDEYFALEIYDEVISAQKSLDITRKCQENQEDKYGTNSKAAIILISGNKKNVGEVLNINNELAELLGYDKLDMIGSNIGKLMPTQLADKHDDLIRKYFEKPATERIQDEKEKIVYGMNKAGLVIPCSFIHKIVPTLDKGIQLIGFLLPAENISELRVGEENLTVDEVALILTDNNWNIHGFNLKTAKLFGIDPNLINIRRYFTSDELLNLSKLIPRLEDPDTESSLKSDAGLEVTMDLEHIRKQIEAEVDTNPEGEVGTSEHTNKFIATETHDENEKDDSVSVSSVKKVAKYLKGVVKYVDKYYGRTQNNLIGHLIYYRVITIKFNEKTQKEVEKKVDHSNMGDKQFPKEMELMLEELASQSQSSVSQMSYLKIEARFIKEFKSKMHQMEEPFFLKCLFKIGILLFFILLGLAIANLILKKNNISSISNNLNYVYTSLKMYKRALEIPLYSGVIFNIYEANESNTYGKVFDNRVIYYLGQIAQAAEFVRENHLTLTKSNLINNSRSVFFQQLVDLNKDAIQAQYTYEKAINSYIAASTQLFNSDPDIFIKPSNHADLKPSLKKLKFFLINNGKTTLRTETRLMANNLLLQTQEEFNSRKVSLLITEAMGIIFVFVVACVFIPYIMSVQKNILILFDHICDIDSNEVKNFLEICNAFTVDIQAPFNKLKSIFDKEDFSTETEKRDEQVTVENGEKKVVKRKKIKSKEEKKDKRLLKRLNLLKKKKIKKKSSKKSEDDESEDDESSSEDSESEEPEEEILIPIDEQRKAAKKKIFSQLARSKRTEYILRIGILVVFFVIFLIIQIVSLIYFFNDTNSAFNLIPVFNSREESLKDIMIFQREEIIKKEAQLDFDGSNLVSKIIVKAFQTESNFLTVRRNLTGSLIDFKTFLNAIDKNACSYLKTYDADFKTNCSQIFNQMFNFGFSNSILSVLKFYQDSHYRFNKYNDTSSEFILREINSQPAMETFDSTVLYIIRGLRLQDDNYQNIIINMFDSQSSYDNIIFTIFITLLIIVFYTVWLILLNSIKMDILRAKGVFNLLPTTHLTKNSEFIHSICKTSIFS